MKCFNYFHSHTQAAKGIKRTRALYSTAKVDNAISIKPLTCH